MGSSAGAADAKALDQAPSMDMESQVGWWVTDHCYMQPGQACCMAHKHLQGYMLCVLTH